MTLDVVEFLRSTLEDMRDDVSYAYPKPYWRKKGEYDPDRGHAAMMMVSSKIETLNNFLDALESRVAAITPTETPLPLIDVAALS
jgi:hypothetical protein